MLSLIGSRLMAHAAMPWGMNLSDIPVCKADIPSHPKRRAAARDVAFSLQSKLFSTLNHVVMRSRMKRETRKPARSRSRERSRQDEMPKPGGVPERNRGERDRNAPLPEEETYEREPQNRSRNEQM
jgi:hypothetical protein